MKSKRTMTTIFKKKTISMRYIYLFSFSILIFAGACRKDEVVPEYLVVTQKTDFSLSLNIVKSTSKKTVSFTCAGKVTKGLAKDIVAQGICWNTTGDPTTKDNHEKYTMVLIPAKQRVAGTDTMRRAGADTMNISLVFSRSVDSLELNMPCFLRVYITLAGGATVYGNTVRIDGFCSDVENNVYRTITVGSQVWMAEDLRTRHFQNGDSLNTRKRVAGGFVDLVNVITTSKGSVLYNWNALTDSRNVAPEGWHVATDDEWKELEKYIGLSQADVDQTGWRGTNEGDKLKYVTDGVNEQISKNSWASSSDQYAVYPSNESGFGAHATNCWKYDVTWGYGGNGLNKYQEGQLGFWWTASANSDNEAWYRYLDYNQSKVFRAYGNKSFGYAIRCVKDK